MKLSIKHATDLWLCIQPSILYQMFVSIVLGDCGDAFHGIQRVPGLSINRASGACDWPFSTIENAQRNEILLSLRPLFERGLSELRYQISRSSVVAQGRAPAV